MLYVYQLHMPTHWSTFKLLGSGTERKTISNEFNESVYAYFTTTDTFTPLPPCSHTSNNSKEIKVHYSFNYAQQMHYPSDPLQPGPIYFHTPQTWTVFGVACEALPRQINFYQTKPETVVKVPMLWLGIFTTSLTIMALERGMSTCMQTTAQGKTSTAA